jgi:[ribosomal protein S5]-alanine N-acetyltransferase
MELERLSPRHAAALLDFEVTNRAYFARSIPDRGDAFFVSFDARLDALLAEQEAGGGYFHVLVEDGVVVGRFNLFDVGEGGATLGYRVGERFTGRGVAKEGVRRVAALARASYGLNRLIASATLDNPASLAVLRASGFTPVAEFTLNGRPARRHLLDLNAPAPA